MRLQNNNLRCLLPLLLAGILCIYPARGIAESICDEPLSQDQQSRIFILANARTDEIKEVDYNSKQPCTWKPWSSSIHPGNMVQLESTNSSDFETFVVTKIKTQQGKGSHDPTGVRKRLHRCRRKGPPLLNKHP